MGLTLFEVLTLIIGSVTACILVMQASIALKVLKADHERRKKQATVEYIQKLDLLG